jgi:hypothetical protein
VRCEPLSGGAVWDSQAPPRAQLQARLVPIHILLPTRGSLRLAGVPTFAAAHRTSLPSGLLGRFHEALGSTPKRAEGWALWAPGGSPDLYQ